MSKKTILLQGDLLVQQELDIWWNMLQESDTVMDIR